MVSVGVAMLFEFVWQAPRGTKGMSQADKYFHEYAQSHQNHVNKLIHWVCVPTIFISSE
jgi:hypothetical protein